MNTPVSFEIAKLLKEKGFNIPCENRYDESGEFTATKLGMHMQPNNYSDSYSAPTIAEVIMWLYEKHDIWINVKTIKWNYEHNTIRFNYNICKFNDKNPSDIIDTVYDVNSPTEAYSAAIEYTLTNLIK